MVVIWSVAYKSFTYHTHFHEINTCFAWFNIFSLVHLNQRIKMVFSIINNMYLFHVCDTETLAKISRSNYIKLKECQWKSLVLENQSMRKCIYNTSMHFCSKVFKNHFFLLLKLFLQAVVLCHECYRKRLSLKNSINASLHSFSSDLFWLLMLRHTFWYL